MALALIISSLNSSGVGSDSAVMMPSPPALLTAPASGAKPTWCIPPCTIGCLIPSNLVNLVESISVSFVCSRNTSLKWSRFLSTRQPTLTACSSAQQQPRSSTYSLKLGRDLDTALAEVKIGEKYDLLAEFKQWARQDPEAARDLLVQRPTIAQALLKLFIELKMCQVPPDSDLGVGEGEEYKKARLAQASPGVDAQQQLLLSSVLALTEAEIAQFDFAQQQQVRAIRASFRG
ncbi:hypothetical protein BASA81_002702 [Batrachochytrium salamandrivorans]|nr:hypothetical protein BASA81_002702 [Batrachochytrium salamandrivorans]